MNERRSRRPGRPSSDLRVGSSNRTWYIISLILVGVIIASMVISALVPSVRVDPNTLVTPTVSQ